MLRDKAIASAVKDPAFVARFFAKVRKTDSCWLWTGWCDPHGYGETMYRTRRLFAHRVAWAIRHGTHGMRGLNVCHDCPSGDNPTCVNPKHLWLGTHTDNAADMMAKGRNMAPTGEHNGKCRVTDAEIRELREMGARGESTGSIGRRFKLGRGTVSQYLRGIWRCDAGGPIRGKCGPARGERAGGSKFTSAQVLEMRSRYAAGESQGSIARAFGTRQTHVLKIVNRHIWKHL